MSPQQGMHPVVRLSFACQRTQAKGAPGYSFASFPFAESSRVREAELPKVSEHAGRAHPKLTIFNVPTVAENQPPGLQVVKGVTIYQFLISL